uniref:Nucleoporin Nup133/Nup155-like N-terminal domain-containing protein n=1 Tax=Panagrolaimus sp. PS1159 TaxID=55785 RepID=A0AC35G9Z2_9BILA
MVSRVNEYYENDINDQDLAIKMLKKNSPAITSSGVQENEYVDFKGVFGNERLSEFEPFRYYEFPQELRHQLNKSQSHISMGLFSTIGRAWMSVDGDLFFWKFDTNSDLAYFDSIKDTITHVQLVHPKRQYTDSKIHFIVVVITNDTPIQNVIGTKEGRIFFAGQDSLYELYYQTGTWFRGPKCDKYNHTKNYISTFIPAISFLSAAEEIRLITVDDTRHILYTLGDKSTIQVFDLGSDGLSLGRKTSCSLLDIQKEIRSCCGVEVDFLASIVTINAIPSTRSQYACLEAVTSKGMRIYFTVYPTAFTPNYPIEQSDARPTTFRVIHIRYPPNEIYGLNCGVNIYCSQRENESFILGHMIDENETSMTAFSSSTFQYALTFIESFAVFPFDGSVWAMALLPESTATSSTPPNIVPIIDTPWIVRQHAELTHKLYILSSEGVYIFQKLSPLEIFRRLLSLYDCDSRQFLTYSNFHGPLEICVMALTILATNLADDAQIENSAV